MPVWDDLARDVERPAPQPEVAPPLAPIEVVAQGRARDDLRLAAQKDAAEIVTRARRDIRRVVSDARRELLELSAQVQAANLELADPTILDRAVIDTLVVEPERGDPWMALAPESETPRHEPVVPEPHEPFPHTRDDSPVSSSVFATHQEPPRTTRTLVALVTVVALVGLLALTGVARWFGRPAAPSTEASAATTAPVAAPPAPATPAAPAPVEATAPPVRPESLSVALEAQRATWIRTTIDGVADEGRTYAAGETQRINGASVVSIRAGDAGGLLVSVDGAPATPFGPDGMAVTRRFTRAQPTTATPEPPSAPPAPAELPARATSAAPAPPLPSPVARASQAGASSGTTVPPTTPLGAAETTRPALPPTPVATPPPAGAGRSAAASPPPGGGRSSAPGRVDIAASGRQWLDAYHRQDLAAMAPLASASIAINDERRPDQRFPFGLEITRAFEDEQLQLSGDTATFTARMIERASTGALIARVSQTWVRRLGEWRLQETRIVPQGQLPPAER